MNRRSFLAAACGAALVLAACGSDDSSTDATAAPAGTTAGADPITIQGAWARTSPAMADAGAAYFTVTSAVDDQLVGVSVESSVAGSAEMHETVMGDAGAADTTMGGMASDTTAMTGDTTAMTGDTMAPTMQMQPVASVDLPAGTAVAFAPGGYHIMLMKLAKPLELGQTFTLTLDFAKAGSRDVTVTVADEAP